MAAQSASRRAVRHFSAARINAWNRIRSLIMRAALLDGRSTLSNVHDAHMIGTRRKVHIVRMPRDKTPIIHEGAKLSRISDRGCSLMA